MTAFTHYWRNDSWDADLGQPLEHAASNAFRSRGVREGDRIFVITIKEGRLFVGGRLIVGKLTTQKGAEKLLRTALWPARDHIVAQKPQGVLQAVVVPNEIARRLRFVPEKALIWTSSGELDRQTVRGVRRLTDDSARLLDDILAENRATAGTITRVRDHVANARTSISSFFRSVLGAPLSNTRWSWGAVNPHTDQVFLRVWVDERKTVAGVDQIHLLGPDWSRGSPGYPQRERQVQLLRSGAEGYGVLCVAQNPNTRGPRKIKEFDDQMLLRFGPLIDEGGSVYATITGTASAGAVTQPLQRAVVRQILDNITAEDVRGALRRLRDGATHSFGPSISWDVVHAGRRYPPKAVLGLAAERLAGRPLGPRDFQSGPNKDGFRALERLGFPPVEKTDTDRSHDEAENTAEQEVLRRTDIGETEKERLVKARRGQGIFRDNLKTVEKRCRLTGVKESEHLRASHIKPWRKCTDAEKLDRFNGLLLSPHVDHLFDRGYISFDDDGSVLISELLKPDVLQRWGLQLPKRTGGFRSEQRKYLAYHRRHLFLRNPG